MKQRGLIRVKCIGFTMRSVWTQHVNSESGQGGAICRGIHYLIVSSCGFWLHLSLLGGAGGGLKLDGVFFVDENYFFVGVYY